MIIKRSRLYCWNTFTVHFRWIVHSRTKLLSESHVYIFVSLRISSETHAAIYCVGNVVAIWHFKKSVVTGGGAVVVVVGVRTGGNGWLIMLVAVAECTLAMRARHPSTIPANSCNSKVFLMHCWCDCVFLAAFQSQLKKLWPSSYISLGCVVRCCFSVSIVWSNLQKCN